MQIDKGSAQHCGKNGKDKWRGAGLAKMEKIASKGTPRRHREKAA